MATAVSEVNVSHTTSISASRCAVPPLNGEQSEPPLYLMLTHLSASIPGISVRRGDKMFAMKHTQGQGQEAERNKPQAPIFCDSRVPKLRWTRSPAVLSQTGVPGEQPPNVLVPHGLTNSEYASVSYLNESSSLFIAAFVFGVILVKKDEHPAG